MNPIAEEILMHYGTPKRSGRYPWGSGKNPHQHSGDFLSRIDELKKQGLTEKQISESFGLTTTQFRTQKSLAKDERRTLDVATARGLREKGFSLNEIADKMGYNGRRIYDSAADLAKALNVGAIYDAEQFEGKTRTTSDSKVKQLLGIFVNMGDYNFGATKGGQVTNFSQFDIDFNLEKMLIETRLSGALTRIKAAIALEEDVTPVDETDSSDNTNVSG